MTPEPSLAALIGRYGRDWQIRDWYGNWVAIRRTPVSELGAGRGLETVVAADNLRALARKLLAQAEAETRLMAELGRPRPPRSPS